MSKWVKISLVKSTVTADLNKGELMDSTLKAEVSMGLIQTHVIWVSVRRTQQSIWPWVVDQHLFLVYKLSWS